MTRIVPVQGTGAWLADANPQLPRNWWRAGSPLMQFLARHGVAPAHPEDPFCWTTELDGLIGDDRDWTAGGKALRWWLTAKGVPLEHRNFWVHSHGLQVFLHAAAEWHEPIFARSVVSFGSPLRKDTPVAAALPRIARWLAVTSSDRDVVQVLGRVGDRSVGSAALPEHVDVLAIPGIDHSKLLQDPFFFDALVGHGIVAFTRTARFQEPLIF